MNQLVSSIGDCFPAVNKKTYRLNKKVVEKVSTPEPSAVSKGTQPYLTVDQYNRDVKIKFHKMNTILKKENVKPRQAITSFSERSAKRCKFALRNSIHLMKAIVCLTYPSEYPEDGRAFKRHLDTFQKRLKRLSIQGFTCMEFQERGAPHYHILITGILDRHELSRMWFEIVNSGDPQHLQAGTSIQFIVDDDDYRLEPDRVRYREMKRKGRKNVKRMFIARAEAESYMIGYFKKMNQKVIPDHIKNAGRFWSHNRGLVAKLHAVVLSGNDHDLKRKVRLLRRWYMSKLRSWGIRYKGQFLPEIIWDGMRFVNDLLRHARGDTLEPASS